MSGSVTRDPIWHRMEWDHELRDEFARLHMDPEACVLLVGACVLKLGDFRGNVLAAPEWGVRRWIEARTGVGPRLASRAISVAIEAANPHTGTFGRGALRRRSGRIEIPELD